MPDGVPCRSLLSRKQERNFHTASSLFVGCAEVSRPRYYFSVSGPSDPDTNDKNPNLVRASHPAGDSRPLNFSRCVVVSRPRHSIQRQAAEYRARFAGRQLGANLLESVRKKPAKPSFYFASFFSSFQQSFFGNQIYGA